MKTSAKHFGLPDEP